MHLFIEIFNNNFYRFNRRSSEPLSDSTVEGDDGPCNPCSYTILYLDPDLDITYQCKAMSLLFPMISNYVPIILV